MKEKKYQPVSRVYQAVDSLGLLGQAGLRGIALYVVPFVLGTLLLMALLVNVNSWSQPASISLDIQTLELIPGAADPVSRGLAAAFLPNVGVSKGDLEKAIKEIEKSPSGQIKRTGNSTNDFLIFLDANQRNFQSSKAQRKYEEESERSGGFHVEFPSRHAQDLACWRQDTGAFLGAIDRLESSGKMGASRGGFALRELSSAELKMVCKGSFSGPAKISANIVSGVSLAAQERRFEWETGLLVGGMGILASFVLIAALITRQSLYVIFGTWLLLSMRMGMISAGSDFSFAGLPLHGGWLALERALVSSLYCGLTVALFSEMFQEHWKKQGYPISLRICQVSATLLVACALLASYAAYLPVLWVVSSMTVIVLLVQLAKLAFSWKSRVALWYGLSMLVTVLASMSEVVSAALGFGALMGVFNHVIAALLSSLLASLAIAQQMREERDEKNEAKESLRAAYEGSPIGLFTMDAQGKISQNNTALDQMLGRAGAKTGWQFRDHFEPGDWERLEGLLKADGSFGSDRTEVLEMEARAVFESSQTGDAIRWVYIQARATKDGQVEGSLQDITERVIATERLKFLSERDPLTECFNLRGVSNALEQMHDKPMAVAYFDLDRFKLINDLYGHAAGDEVLRQVCARMRVCLAPEDVLARVGGDEFVALFPRATIDEARARCLNLVRQVAGDPYTMGAKSFGLSVSGGLVETARLGAVPARELISSADSACRMAKKSEFDRLVVIEHASPFFKRRQEELELLDTLGTGEAPDGLFLVMQPIMSLTAPFDSLNFEVLLRMKKPDGSIIPAGPIIQTAESHGRIAIIDKWVLSNVLDWLDANVESLRATQFVCVNLSGGSLNDESFLAEAYAMLDRRPKAATFLCLEITESVALHDLSNMRRFIEKARSYGARVAIDDFGAGYSSFGYLKGLPADALKIDGQLVMEAPTNPASHAIVVAIAGLVQGLGMKSVGEFAENLAVIKCLASSGVDYAQGYGICRPILPEKLLTAKSAADFIEDPAVLAFVKQLQTGVSAPAFPESDTRVLH